MAVNTSPKWQIDTVQAGATLDPPRDYKNIVADIESRAAGAPQLVANVAGRDAIPTAQLYNGKRVEALDTRTEWEWSGSAWLPRKEDTGWVNVTVNSGFSQQGAQAPRVRRVNGQVFFDWGFSNTGLVAGTAQIVGVVPVGFRPTGGSAYCNAISNTATTGSGARFELQPGGNVSLLVPATLGTYYLAASGSSYFI